MSSSVDRAQRLNLGIYVTGQTGSGKSRRLARLAALWPRVLYVDPTNSFDARAVVEHYDDFKSTINAVWCREPLWSIACQFGDDREYVQLFQQLVAVGKKARGAIPPVLLVLDEADMFCSPREIDPGLSWLLRYGRHFGFSWLASARADVQIHRDIRTNAYAKLLYRQGMLSAEMRQELRYAAAQRGEVEPSISRLTPHGPDEPDVPVEGTHYYSLPEPWHVVAPHWAAVARHAARYGAAAPTPHEDEETV